MNEEISEEIENQYNFLANIANFPATASRNEYRIKYSEKIDKIFRITRSLYFLKLSKIQNTNKTIKQIYDQFNAQIFYSTHHEFGFDSFFIVNFNSELPFFYNKQQAPAQVAIAYFNSLEDINAKEREFIYQYFSFSTFPSIYKFFIYKEILQSSFVFLKQIINGIDSPSLATYLVSSYLLSAYKFNSTLWRRLSLTFNPSSQYDFLKIHSYFLNLIMETSFLLPSEYVSIMHIFKQRFPNDFAKWFISSFFGENLELQIKFTHNFHNQNKINQLRSYLNDLLLPENNDYIFSIFKCFSLQVGTDSVLPSIKYELEKGLLHATLTGRDVSFLNNLSVVETKSLENVKSPDFLFNFQIQTPYSDDEKSPKQDGEKSQNQDDEKSPNEDDETFSIQDLIGDLSEPIELETNIEQEKVWNFLTDPSIYRDFSLEERKKNIHAFTNIIIDEIYFKNKQISIFKDSLETLDLRLTYKSKEKAMISLKQDINDIYSLYFSYFASIDSFSFIQPNLSSEKIIESIQTQLNEIGIHNDYDYYFLIWVNIIDSLDISFDKSIEYFDKQFWEIINKRLKQIQIDKWDKQFLINVTNLMNYFSFFQDFKGQGYGKRLNFICYFMQYSKIVSCLQDDVFVYFLAQIKDIETNELFETFLFFDAFIFMNNDLCLSFSKEIMNNWLLFYNSMLSLTKDNAQLFNFVEKKDLIRSQFTIKRK